MLESHRARLLRLPYGLSTSQHMFDPVVLLLLCVSHVQGGADLDELDSTLHKRLNASLSTFSIAQLSLLVSVRGQPGVTLKGLLCVLVPPDRVKYRWGLHTLQPCKPQRSHVHDIWTSRP